MESLLQATGLPAELLQQALAPLTEGEGEAVLLRSCAPGGERGAGHPRGCWGSTGGGGGARGDAEGLGGSPAAGAQPWGEVGAGLWGGCVCGAGGSWARGRWGRARGDGSGPWGSCREQLGARLTVGRVLAPGALRLNRAALAQASGRQLRLLPRQRYLRAERAESGALERKRNVLCCLLSRILKAEKRLHIDNLVFRVGRLQAGGGEGLPGGRAGRCPAAGGSLAAVGARCLPEGRAGAGAAVPELLLPQRGRAVLRAAPAEPGLPAAPGGEAPSPGVRP